MLINLSFIIKRFLRNGRRHWDSFCEYTELPGFRFMTSKVTYIVRIVAITTSIFCLIGMCAQLYYLILQYLRNQIQTSSRKYKIQHMALPLVYLCHPLDRKFVGGNLKKRENFV
ncbi:unnamed protein product [Meloidogyne enterolobii]|uniref:Uncharacterized protein n=1 Tax=Meloidogyne enterolobii TaxID=390850 RepID=A0ACB0ZB34_MELEN